MAEPELSLYRAVGESHFRPVLPIGPPCEFFRGRRSPSPRPERSIVSRHRITRAMISAGRRASTPGLSARVMFASFLALLPTIGCHLPDAASPELLARSARASIGMEAQVVAIAADHINVRITYSLQNGGVKTLIDSTVSIHKTETGTVDWVGVRGFPVEIDLAQCLLDPAHAVAGTGCLIGITIRLLQNTTEVDRTVINPFKVEPGRINVVPQTIVLREVGSVDIDAPVRLIRVGDGLSLSVRVADVAGNPITGRAVSWRSADEGIARVQSDGTVTGVAAGQVTLTARAGTREGSVTLTVSPQ